MRQISSATRPAALRVLELVKFRSGEYFRKLGSDGRMSQANYFAPRGIAKSANMTIAPGPESAAEPPGYHVRAPIGPQ